jgi:hypothetical protein
MSEIKKKEKENEINKYTPIDENFDILEKELVKCKSDIMQIMVKFRKLRTEFRKYGKEMEKKKVKKKQNTTNYQESFNISEELSTFLNVDKDIKLNCSEINRRINIYINKNNLQDGVNIKLDKKLKDLLKPGKKENITLFNLQIFLKKHYIKK